MNSVTQRISQIKQPRGGFVKKSEFSVISLQDGNYLNSDENIHGTLVGLCVDYMTRFISGKDKLDSFRISIEGAYIAEKFGMKDSLKTVIQLLDEITGIDDNSIVNACKVVTFDVWKRNCIGAMLAKNYEKINPDESTVENIRILINRSLYFFENYGPVIKNGFTFEPVPASMDLYNKMLSSGNGSYGGYTATVSSGDGDFLTKDTLWDFKVSKAAPKSKDILQILMYWIMGQYSGQEIFRKIEKIGVFNPRLNNVYLLEMKNVSKEIINTIERDVIGY